MNEKDWGKMKPPTDEELNKILENAYKRFCKKAKQILEKKQKEKPLSYTKLQIELRNKLFKRGAK